MSKRVEEWTIEVIEELGALITNGHYIYNSGKHGEVYVAKDLVMPSTIQLNDMCAELAGHYMVFDAAKRAESEIAWVDTVIGPAPNGAVLASRVAEVIHATTGRPAFAVYAEKGKKLDGDGKPEFEVRPTFERFLDETQTVVVVEDVINSGRTVKKIVELVQSYGAKVCSIAALWNRGGVTAEDLGVPDLFSLVNVR